jgi:4,5-DOPA dioxygenase extradiol
MADQRFPTVFVSHGSPMLAVGDSTAAAFLQSLGPALGTPRAILVISAHWDAPHFAVSAAASPRTIHDFGGFPRELYELRYPAPGAPELAGRAAGLLEAAGIACEVARDRGLDHGAWVPLLLMYSDAGAPVTQVAVSSARGPAAHVAVGRALAPLRDEGVLILGSGSAIHNLGRLDFQAGPPPAWVAEFEAWLNEKVVAGAVDELVGYRALAPSASVAHPTDEHLMPIFVALGAVGEGARGEILHRSFDLGSLSMACYAFDARGR